MKWSERDLRGQLFLIGAIALALTFVGITLLLNSAIFSDSIASRGPDTANTDVQRLNESAESYIESQLLVSNQNQSLSSNETLNSEVDAAFADWSTITSDSFTQTGTAVSSEITGRENGTRLGQDTVREYTDKDDDDSWFVLREPNTDGYELELYVTEVSGTFTVQSGPRDTSSLFGLNSSEEVVITKSGGQLDIRAFDDSGASLGTCTVDAPNGNEAAVIDITEGKINDQQCSPVQQLEFEEDESVTYLGGDQIKGAWSLTTEEDYNTNNTSSPLTPPSMATNQSNYYDEQSDGAPYVDQQAIYSVNYSLWYTESDADYRVNGTVHPDANSLVLSQLSGAVFGGGGGGGGGGSPPSVTIDSTSTTNAAGGNTDFTVQYTASDPDGDLNEAKITLTSSSGSTQTFTDPDPSGGDYSDTVGFNPSTIEVEVVDTAGNTDTDTSSI